MDQTDRVNRSIWIGIWKKYVAKSSTDIIESDINYTIYSIRNCICVNPMILMYRVFRYLRPSSTADLGIGTYENCMFSGPYINSRLPCKFSELKRN